MRVVSAKIWLRRCKKGLKEEASEGDFVGACGVRF